MNQPASKYDQHPDYDVHFEPCPKRLRVMFNGEVVADTTRSQYLRETKHLPVYYFPIDDVRRDLLIATDHSSHCPFKGDASYWTVKVGDHEAENAVWSYNQPYPEAAEIKDYLAFYWDRMDHWYEEDEEVFVHPRDPKVRLDILDCSRPVQVMVSDQVVADSNKARLLFETGLPTRYYLPQDDVHLGLLQPSDRSTSCPYKGTANYWHVKLGNKVFKDLVWSYPDPAPEAAQIKGYFCFFNEQVGAIHIDGVKTKQPVSKWSPK